MKKISILIILLSMATIVGFALDYLTSETKLKSYQWQAEILESKYNDEEPSIDYTGIKKQRDSLYFLLNQERIMKFREEIYKKIVSQGYDKSYEHFISVYGDSEKAYDFWETLEYNEFYEGQLYQFKIQFYGILPTK